MFLPAMLVAASMSWGCSTPPPAKVARAEAPPPPEPPEVAKSRDALTVAYEFWRGGHELDAEESRDLAVEARRTIRAHASLANPDSVGAPAGRHVVVSFTFEEHDGATGLDERLTLQGFGGQRGKSELCLVFKMSFKLTMDHGRVSSSDDVTELRKNAVREALSKIHAIAPGIDPSSCGPTSSVGGT